MTGSTDQRTEVWKGNRLKTSGGLYLKDLIKNKRGKIVSRKKSGQARSGNNLGKWLRAHNEKVGKSEMLRKGSAPPEGAKAAVAKPKPAAAKPKPKPKPAAPKPKPKAKPAAPKPAAQPRAVRRKRKKLPAGYNPITRQPYEKKSKSGYVATGDVNLDNITTMGREVTRRRRRGKLTAAEARESLAADRQHVTSYDPNDLGF